jgi:outer membrane protein W
MKRVLSFGAVALLLVVPVASASAQGKISGFAAIGGSTVTGEFKEADSTKSGFFGQAGLEYKFSEPLWLRMDVSMGWNDRLGDYAEDAYIWTFALRAEYWLSTGSSIRPYVTAGGGIMTYKRNPGESGNEDAEPWKTKHRMMASGGVGVDYAIGSASIFVEGRYDMAFAKDGEEGTRAVIPIMIGARWGGR